MFYIHFKRNISCHVGLLYTDVSRRKDEKKKCASKNFPKSELPFWDAGVEFPNLERCPKIENKEGRCAVKVLVRL
jgi:hypothetical protein